MMGTGGAVISQQRKYIQVTNGVSRAEQWELAPAAFGGSTAEVQGVSCSAMGLTAVRTGTGCASDTGSVWKPIKANLKY